MKNLLFCLFSLMMMVVPFSEVFAENPVGNDLSVQVDAPMASFDAVISMDNVVLPIEKHYGNDLSVQADVPMTLFDAIFSMENIVLPIEKQYGNDLFIGLDSQTVNSSVFYLKHRFASDIPIVIKAGTTVNMFLRVDGSSYIQYAKGQNAGNVCPDVQGLQVGTMTLMTDFPIVVIQGDDAIATISDGNSNTWHFFKMGYSSN